MKAIYSLLFIILTFTSTVFSQNYVFRVMANNGSNEFKPVSSSEWSPVKRGVSFKSGDVVKIADQAYLGLIHNSGKTVELNDPGTFKVDDIELNIDVRKKGIGSKYTEFVMNTLDEDAEFEGQKTLATRGGDKAVRVYAPASAEVYGSNQLISWETDSESATYHVIIKGIFDDVLLEEDVRTNEYLLDLENPAIKDEKTLILTVSEKGSNAAPKEHALDVLSKDEAADYEKDLVEIQENVNISLLRHLVLASYFEEKGLLIDAATNYQEANKLAPEIDDIRELFESFKARNKLE